MIKLIISTLLGKYKTPFSVSMAAAVFGQLISLMVPLSFMAVIDRVLISGNKHSLNVILILLFVNALIEIPLSYYSSRLNLWLGCSHMAEVSHAFYSKLMAMRLPDIERLTVGKIISLLSELDSIKSTVTNWVSGLILDVLFMLVFFCIAVSINKTLTLLLVLTVPLHFLQYYFFSKKLKVANDVCFAAGVSYQNDIIECIESIDIIKSGRKESFFLDRIYSALSVKLGKMFSLSCIGVLSSFFSGAINKISDIVLLYFGAVLVLDGSISLGELIAFNMMRDKITSPLLRLASIWEEVLMLKMSVDRVNAVVNSASENEFGRVDNIENEFFLDNVGVSFDGVDVLSSIDLKMKIGDAICIVGGSGVGKTTLSKIITGAISDYSGQISVDNVCVDKNDVSSLRELTAVVPQTSKIITGTIADNILFFSDDKTESWLNYIANICLIDEFVSKLPNGYGTHLTMNNHGLSGGQVQRISIARALASKRKIIVLDEATSSLDVQTESLIIERIPLLCREKILIMITHRDSLLSIANRTLSIVDGRLYEM